MPSSESAAHKELKRLALAWALAHEYPVAAAEVSLPHYRFRLDVAAYRPHALPATVIDSRTQRPRRVWRPAVGVTAVFECKASPLDFRRDARSMTDTLQQLEVLHARKTRIEEELHLFYPSIRNGDSLFQEFETLDFTRPGHERYQRTLLEIQQHVSRLHTNTKFDKLVRWGAANVFYVVAEPGIVRPQELPACWGLLVRESDGLHLHTKPLLHEVDESARLTLLHRIAQAGTRAALREHQITLEVVNRMPR